MAGFRKATPKQASLKLGLYGPPGSGKTFTALLIAEGLSKISGKRIAYVDTERGTDFYCQSVQQRTVHPEAFDFDAIYTRSITEVEKAVRSLNDNEYGVVVIDSITHIWESAIQAYSGRQTSAGTIPFHAWGKIKKPYKNIMSILLSSKIHVIICGRQGTEYAESEEGELKAVGLKMKAEGETPYEPHILIRMEQIKQRDNSSLICARVEKDRTGILSGNHFTNPTFEHIGKPLLGLLGEEQAIIKTQDETAAIDAESMAEDEIRKQERSVFLKTQYMARIDLADTGDELKLIGKELTPSVKAEMVASDVSELREKFIEKQDRVKK